MEQKWIRIIFIPHGEKAKGDATMDGQVRMNPPMTMPGMQAIYNQVLPLVHNLGPYASMWCSRLGRALCTASILAVELDMDFATMDELGQYANSDSVGDVYGRGHEGENELSWQHQALTALDKIYLQAQHGDTVLVVSHRPILAGLVAAARGIYDLDSVHAILYDKGLTEDGTVVFKYDGKTLTKF